MKLKSTLLLKSAGDYKSLAAILRTRDQAAFENFITRVDLGSDESEEIANLDPNEKKAYVKMIHGIPERKQQWGRYRIPWGISPSLLGPEGILVPTEVIFRFWNLEELLDEYFGIMYDPERERERFEPGFKKALVDKLVKLKGGAHSLIESKEFQEECGMRDDDSQEMATHLLWDYTHGDEEDLPV